MHSFIVIELPARDVPKLPEGLRFAEAIEGLEAAPSRRLVCVTDGQTSCRLVRRSAWDGEDKLRKKYAKKGWSKSRVERALANARRAHDQEDRGNVHQVAFEAWLRSVVAAIGATRIYVHTTSSAVDASREYDAVAVAAIGPGHALPVEGWLTLEP